MVAPFRDDESRRIVDSWRSERPDLDPSPMLVFSRLARLSQCLDKERRAAFAERGLETWQFDVLAELRRGGAPYQATPGKLMANLMVSSGTMTNRIDRLEQQGLVTRINSPRDRRVVIVELTEEGKTRVDLALEALLAVESRLLQALPHDEEQQLAGLLHSLLEQFPILHDET